MPTQILKRKCPTCGKVAEEKARIKIKSGAMVILVYNCKHTEIINIDQIDSSVVFTSMRGFTPYPFQVENAEFVEQSGYRSLIADEPGLGKTISALLTIYRNKPKLLPALFLVKSGLRAQWTTEIIQWLGPEFVPQIIENSKDKAYKGFKTYVCSLDLLSRLNGTFEDIGIKTVIVDECQLIKNSEAKRTQEVRKLCKTVENVIFLSGTPIKNKPEEYFTVLNICRPTLFPTLAGYIHHWLFTDYSGGYVKTMGLRSPERFKSVTSDFIIRHTKDQVLPDLPRIARNLAYTNLEDDDKKDYDKIVDDFVDYAEENEDKQGLEYYQNILAYFSKMRHVTGLAKIDSCYDKVVEFLEETDRKITVFVHHKDVAQILMEKFRDYCIENHLPAPAQISSDMNMDERSRQVQNFQDTSRILVASTLASGEGLNLQFCTDAIMLERQWNPANEEQAECRFERIGVKNPIFISYMIALGTIDEYFTELVERKRVMIKEAMSGATSIAWNEQELMKDLVQTIVSKRNNEKWVKPKF